MQASRPSQFGESPSVDSVRCIRKTCGHKAIRDWIFSRVRIMHELAAVVRSTYRKNRWRARILFACRARSDSLLLPWSYCSTFHRLRQVSTQQESCVMPSDIFPQTTPELAVRRKQLAPGIHDAFTHFSDHVFPRVRCRSRSSSCLPLPWPTSRNVPTTASTVTPRRRYGTGRRHKRLWKPSGSRPKCARAEPTLTRRSPSIRSSK